MRDYLYIWHEPKEQYIIASGIEFKSISNNLNESGGIILIDHQSETAWFDENSRFNYTSISEISDLNSEDIYSWGNFSWANYNVSEPFQIPDQGIAEILYFSHKYKPLNNIRINGIENDYLGYIHDDGWFLLLYYHNWKSLSNLLKAALPKFIGSLDMSALEEGTNGFWLSEGKVTIVEKTSDVDKIININYIKPK